MCGIAKRRFQRLASDSEIPHRVNAIEAKRLIPGVIPTTRARA